MLVLVIEIVPMVDPVDAHLADKEVGAVWELAQFSLVPHFGDCPST